MKLKVKLTPNTIVENHTEIKKSKFITYVFEVHNKDDAKKILSDIKKQHSKATHICYAYIINSPNLEKCSDDGEPAGTAGRPILMLLKKKDITNAICIVVRYFGGIKLGAGGLIRAYSASARDGILLSDLIPFVPKEICIIECQHKNYKQLKAVLDKNNCDIISIEYNENVLLKVEFNLGFNPMLIFRYTEKIIKI